MHKHLEKHWMHFVGDDTVHDFVPIILYPLVTSYHDSGYCVSGNVAYSAETIKCVLL